MHDVFFSPTYSSLVREPNGKFWWHHMPLPDGTRIAGANGDPDFQRKVWQTIGIAPESLSGKSVLDIGANDGYFTLAALACGASKAVALNSADWATYPTNLRYAAARWDVSPEMLVGDFRTYPFGRTFDVILFFGVIYHLEDVFTPIKQLRALLNPGGVLYIETQMTLLQADLPIWESASDIYPSVARQNKAALNKVGISNYLFPNPHAMKNLAHSYDFGYEDLNGESSELRKTAPSRGLFKFTKL